MISRQNETEAALRELLTDLFDGDAGGLRQWVRLRLGKAIHDELPTGIGLAQLAFEVVLAVQRHGRGDATLFASLSQERPRWAARIAAVAAQWDAAFARPNATVADAATTHGFRLWNIPDLPPHYVPRQEEIEALERALLESRSGKIGITAVGQGNGTGASKHGLYGMGGIGKSVLAAALARTPAVQEHFMDGIYWLPVGQTPQIPSLQAQLCKAFGYAEAFDGASEGKQRLRALLTDKAALVVLDDVWDVVHAEQMDVIGARGCLLITTRDRTVLQRSEEHCLDVLPRAQALALLGQWIGQDGTMLPEAAAQVAEACGRLPLALATVGAMVRADEIDWTDALALLAHADLGDLEARFPGYPYPSVLAAIEVSVNALDEPTRARYLDLAIFPEDEPIPEPALEMLWSVHQLTRPRLRRLLGRLAARSLVIRDEHGRIHLHDLQRLYLQKRASALAARHGQLVDAYAAQCPDGLARGHDDGYFFQRLPWHLAHAGRHDELADLCFDFDWLDAKLHATSVFELLPDFGFLPAAHPAAREAHLLQAALRLSSQVLVREPRQLPSQLVGRLGSLSLPPRSFIVGLLEQTRALRRYSWLRPVVAALMPPGGPLLRALTGHADSVLAVAVTPDGRRALSASDDLTLKLWDLERGIELRTLTGHTDSVLAVAITPDGKRALSSSDNRILTIWDLEQGIELRTLRGHTGSVLAMAITPDGKRAVSASSDKTLKSWDLERGTALGTLTGHAGWVTAVIVTPDGRCAVSASLDGTVKVWDLERGIELRTLVGHCRDVLALAITPDGKVAISASADRTLKLWDLDHGTELRTLAGHIDKVRAVAVTLDGKRALSASADRTLKLWDLDHGTELRTLTGHAGWVRAVAMIPNSARAISASDDRTLCIWDLEQRTELRTLPGHTDRVSALAVAANGKRALSASFDRTVKLWDLECGKELDALTEHDELIWTVAMSHDGQHALLAHEETLELWDVSNRCRLRYLTGHAGLIWTAAITADGHHAVTGSSDRTIRFWNLEHGSLLRTLTGHTGSVKAVAMTPDGRYAISASSDRTLKVWNLKHGTEIHTLVGHGDRVSAVAVTANGKCALSGSDDGVLKLWDLEHGTELRTLAGHASSISAVAIAADSKRAVSASYDRALKIWELDTGRLLATFTADGAIGPCASASAGRRFVAGDAQGRLHILELIEPRM